MHIPTFEDIMRPFIEKPKAIQQAIIRVDTHPSFSVLTKSSRAVLRQLVSRAGASNAYQPIKARLSKIEKETGFSYRTVQRAIVMLNTAGLVTRINDGRGEFGLFSHYEFRLSESLCMIIGLPYSETEVKPKTSEIAPQNEIEKFYEQTIEVERRELEPRNRDKNEIVLPQELLELEKLGINKFGICKLRGHAHRRNHRLEHVWRVAKEYALPKKLTKGRLYKYLIAMIVKNVDYSARALQHARLAADMPYVKHDVPVKKKVQDSIKMADSKLKQEIVGLPKGAKANMQLISNLLKKGRDVMANTIGHSCHTVLL